MIAPAVHVAKANLRAGEGPAFTAWQGRHNIALGKFPGFVSSDVIPPSYPDGNVWTIVLNFLSQDELSAWLGSSERALIVDQAIPLFEDGTLNEVAQSDRSTGRPCSNVTEVILSKIKLGMDNEYREWAVRIQAAQAQYPGYQGMYLQPPAQKDGLWTTIIRYDTSEHLESWMSAPERAELLNESLVFIEHEQLMRLATSFPGWIPIDPITGQGPPNWKTALLVVLGLFPIVMIEMRFLTPVLVFYGLNTSLATFIANTISVAGTTFVTMPLCLRWFGWWLFADAKSPSWVTPVGLGSLAALFAIEISALWYLLVR